MEPSVTLQAAQCGRFEPAAGRSPTSIQMESIPLKCHSQGSLADPEARTAMGEPSFAEGNSRINNAKDDGFVEKRPQICLLGLLSYSPEKGFVEELRPGLVSSGALLLLALLSVFQVRSETSASRRSLGGKHGGGGGRIGGDRCSCRALLF